LSHGRETPAGPEPGVELDLAGRTWHIGRACNLEDLWDEMTGEGPEDEDHIPYWTEVWPASKVLASHMASQGSLLCGRKCLDIGCGLGVTAMVAGSLGARVVAMDLELPALDFVRKNAVLNNVPPLGLVRMDWRNYGFKPGAFDFIWAADVLYEKRFCRPLAVLLRYCIRDKGRIWIADPERNISRDIWAYFEEHGFNIREITREEARVDKHVATVRLMELSTMEGWHG
jgi:ETFB lysine methyltransferase